MQLVYLFQSNISLEIPDVHKKLAAIAKTAAHIGVTMLQSCSIFSLLYLLFHFNI